MLDSGLSLAPLPWQQELWQSLSERSTQDRLPHALLLHGAAGVGKGHLARLLALSLLCQKPQNDLPCGHCHACDMFAASSHPDFFLASTAYGLADADEADADSKPRKTKKAVAPSKQIKIDCIRDIIQFSTHSAHQGGRRVVIIEPAELLNHNAANALLKTLEEPGDGLFIILVSHQPSRLMPTLRSRCQALFCATPDHTQATAWLRHQISPERAETALGFCAGAPLRALAAVHNEQDLAWREVILTLEACRNGEVHYLFAGESLDKQAKAFDAVLVLDWWYAHVHGRCKKILEISWLQFADKLLEARRKAQSTANPNVRFLFDALLVDWLALN
jgi:DNA polymerase-3 subunit delta'